MNFYFKHANKLSIRGCPPRLVRFTALYQCLQRYLVSLLLYSLFIKKIIGPQTRPAALALESEPRSKYAQIGRADGGPQATESASWVRMHRGVVYRGWKSGLRTYFPDKYVTRTHERFMAVNNPRDALYSPCHIFYILHILPQFSSGQNLKE